MVGALWTGISGLQGQQRALDNESNNIANVNTLGYKASRIAFSDQMYQDDIGKGVDTFDVEKLYTQGNLKVTGVDYDMALAGDGFFQVSDGRDFYYTRAGNFRMGENGELQNAAGYSVQGWAMAKMEPSEDINSTDENATRFSMAHSKLLGNAIFRNSTDITTKVAKATDYTESAAADSKSVFAGAHQKTASTKISDVEELVTEYNNQLTAYNNAEPKPASVKSVVQKDLLDYDLDTVSLASGDEMYIYIDGDRYAQSFDTDEMTTFKKLVDQISNIPGMKAYLTDGVEPSYDLDTQDIQGKMVIEGLIPGKDFSVTEFGWVDNDKGNQATKGTVQSVQEAIKGTGLAAIKSVEDALADAISGKQKDVWTPEDLFEIDTLDDKVLGDHTFSFYIDIYDKELKENIPIPNDGQDPIGPKAITIPKIGAIENDMTTSAAIDVMVNEVNNDSSMSKYVKAYNINGNFVLKTLDDNSDVEFTSNLKKSVVAATAPTTAADQLGTASDGIIEPSAGEIQTFAFSGPATADGTVEIGNVSIPVTAGMTAIQVAAAFSAEASSLMAANPDIESVTDDGAGNLTIEWTDAAGNQAPMRVYSDVTGVGGGSFTATTEGDDDKGSSGLAADITDLDVPRNASYSGRDGASAEFLAMTTKINQTATKSDIQLRLDTLQLTDSAFGEFSVDSSGLITMKQDGADFAVGQVAVAKFTDNRGLEAIGGNLLNSTNRSGQAIFNTDNEKTAEIKGGTLELSTADLSESLVNLMVFQRAFEANSKSITTSDAILNTLIQMKR